MRSNLSRSMRAVARTFLPSLVGLLITGISHAQSPQVLYTWEGTVGVQDWARNFGTNTVTLDNNTPGILTITETGTPAGTGVAIRDGFNRIIESSTGASGGSDLTGLDFLEFDLGHNGVGPVNVQFYVQASTASNFLALGPDVAVMPGMATYQESNATGP